MHIYFQPCPAKCHRKSKRIPEKVLKVENLWEIKYVWIWIRFSIHCILAICIFLHFELNFIIKSSRNMGTNGPKGLSQRHRSYFLSSFLHHHQYILNNPWFNKFPLICNIVTTIHSLSFLLLGKYEVGRIGSGSGHLPIQGPAWHSEAFMFPNFLKKIYKKNNKGRKKATLSP